MQRPDRPPTVGLIGLGAMGAGMAQSLRRAGHAPHVYDIRAEENLVSADVALRQKAEVGRLRREQQDLARERTIVQNGLAALLGLPAGELSLPSAALSGIDAPGVPAGLPASTGSAVPGRSVGGFNRWPVRPRRRRPRRS